ncbi:MAG: anaerobic sulfatase maturase [Propionivibrio sp.]
MQLTVYPPPPGPRAFHVMAKPIGATCNLRCDYCFYLDKTSLYPQHRAADFRMSDTTLETLVRSVIESRAPGQNSVQFAWQGGEPTLMGLPFFKRAVKLQRRLAPAGVSVQNAFQTNGMLITDDFARFFRDNGFLVGVSIDGPKALHDAHRVDPAGHGSFDNVIDGIETLVRHCVEFNLLTVVHADNSRQPEAVYRFLRTLGTPFLQFIPLVEPLSAGGASARSVSGEAWGQFLNGVFHLWRQEDIGRVFVQHFDQRVAQAIGHPASLCVHAATCGRGLALEHNGDLYSCDHFVTPAHRLGNVHRQTLATMVDAPAQMAFGNAKSETLPDECRACSYLALCHGGCPKDRLISTASGALNWLCEGYRAFYAGTATHVDAMAAAWRARLPAGEYRRFLRPHAEQGAA